MVHPSAMEKQSFREVFERAVHTRRLDDVLGVFADDAVLHSPVQFKPFEGRAAITQLLRILLEVFEDFRYTDQLESDDGTTGLVFRARIGNREVEGLDLLRFNEAGLVEEITVMVRPLSALEALLAEVGPRLAAGDDAP
jgi:hypothetical protein